MAIVNARIVGKSGGSFDALKARLAQGKGKMSTLSSTSRNNKTSWSKMKPKSLAKGNPTLAVSGATPGVKKPGTA